VSKPSHKQRLEHLASNAYLLFFPLGLAASVWGVLLWPAFYARWIQWYPLEAHTRLMATGFAGCFIIGFLSTALPRLLGTQSLRPLALLWHAALAITVIVCLVLNRVPLADLLTALWWLGLMGTIGWSALHERHDVPPPGFPVALASVLGGALSALYLGAVGFGWLVPVGFWWMLSRLWLFQGVIWLAIIGVGPFILPRFFGARSLHDFDESRILPRGWSRQFIGTVIAGSLLALSFVAEARGLFSIGLGGRSAIVLVYFAFANPGIFRHHMPASLAWAIRVALLCGIAGWAAAGIFPQLRVGALHLAFIGCGLLILTVAVRVVLGHSDRLDRLQGRMRMFHLVSALGVLTALTRLSADFLPEIRISHLVYAALCWVLVIAVWVWWLRRELRSPQAAPDHAPVPPAHRTNAVHETNDSLPGLL
jgi:hypothetical protein